MEVERAGGYLTRGKLFFKEWPALPTESESRNASLIMKIKNEIARTHGIVLISTSLVQI